MDFSIFFNNSLFNKELVPVAYEKRESAGHNN